MMVPVASMAALREVLRGLPGADDVDDVDDDCGAFELRLSHFLDHSYNRQPHEALGGQTPLARFAGTDIAAWRHLISGALSVVHDGRLVAFAPVDLAHNAVSRRAVPSAPAPDEHLGSDSASSRPASVPVR